MLAHAVDSDRNTWGEFVTGNDVTIYGLEADSSYVVSVCAETAAGCGEENIVERRTLLDGRKCRDGNNDSLNSSAGLFIIIIKIIIT